MNTQGMMSSSSPSRTRISTTSTSYSLYEVLAEDAEVEMKPMELGGEVEAMSRFSGMEESGRKEHRRKFQRGR